MNVCQEIVDMPSVSHLREQLLNKPQTFIAQTDKTSTDTAELSVTPLIGHLGNELPLFRRS